MTVSSIACPTRPFDKFVLNFLKADSETDSDELTSGMIADGMPPGLIPPLRFPPVHESLSKELRFFDKEILILSELVSHFF